MRLRNLEIIFIGLGFVLTLVSAYLFTVDADLVLRFMGMDRFSKRTQVAQVEVLNNMVRRKEFEMPEFRSVEARQAVYSKDSIMTGANSGTVLKFLDGSLVELGPDTLVQIETRGSPDSLGNFELILNVKSGEVTGSSDSKRIKVLRDNRVVAIAPIQKLKPQPKRSDCTFTSQSVKKTDVFIWLSCEEDAIEAKMKVVRPDGVLADTKVIPIAPNHQGKFQFGVTMPGDYILELVQERRESARLSVGESIADLKWLDSPVLCGEGLRYESTSKSVSKVIVEDHDHKILHEFKGDLGGRLMGLQSIQPPAELRVVEIYSDGFKGATPFLNLSKWRTCPILRSPSDGSVERLGSTKGVMFTWSASKNGEDHFLFELSREPNFSKVIFSKAVQMNLIRITPPFKGTAYWRVTDVSSRESAIPFKVIFR
jgi:hypothetical protein